MNKIHLFNAMEESNGFALAYKHWVILVIIDKSCRESGFQPQRKPTGIPRNAGIDTIAQYLEGRCKLTLPRRTYQVSHLPWLYGTTPNAWRTCERHDLHSVMHHIVTDHRTGTWARSTDFCRSRLESGSKPQNRGRTNIIRHFAHTQNPNTRP